MMKRLIVMLVLLLGATRGEALLNFAEIYPPVVQELSLTEKFNGDRHGEFWGDSVAVLTDGSAWKVHPNSEGIYRMWQLGDAVRVTVRTEFYWFKREHKFALYNTDRGEFVKVMLVEHTEEPLVIVSTETYHKSYVPIYNSYTSTYTDQNGNIQSQTHSVFSHYEPADFRKILWLSDGSIWVIKDHLQEFHGGMRVYVGAQGSASSSFYDFFVIVGDQREAVWALARPQK